MKRILFLLFFLAACTIEAAEFHVSVTGNDNAEGSADAPFATFEKARGVMRSLRKKKPDEPITIYFHAGTYYFPNSLNLTKEDSGTKNGSLTIAAWQNTRPVLVGGTRITDWTPCTDPAYPRGTMQADLGKLGIAKRFKILYSGGRTMTWARYPNAEPELPYSGGWAYVDGEPFNMYQEVPGERLDTIQMKKPDLRNWSRPTDGFVSIFPRHNWWNVVRQIKEIDRETGLVTVTNNMSYAARPADRYCVFGMREELDVPGEWYQDLETKILYFLPETADSLKEVVVPTAEQAIQLSEASHIQIRGLTVYAGASHGIKLGNCEDCVVEKCTVHDVSFDSGAGIQIWNGRRCGVLGCDVYQTGSHGISMRGGDLFTLDACGHVAENNYVHHTGNVFKHGNGIDANGCGLRVAHNLIHDMPRLGIQFGGADIVIEYNDVRHVNLEMEDSGVIYTNGSHWMNSRGSTIRYNRFRDSIGFGHHLGKYKFYMFTWGIYLDDNTGGVDVYGNVSERCTIGCFHLHNSRDNHLYNNIFVDGGSQQFQLSGWTDDPENRFIKRHRDDMVKAYERAMKHPGWHNRRGMKTHPMDAVLKDGTIMANNRIERNIFYWPDRPKSQYVRTNKCNFTVNLIDDNIVWNGGGEPIRTGFSGVKGIEKVLTDKIPGVDFLEARSDGLPTGWTWYQKTRPDAKVEVVNQALRLYAAYNPEGKYIKEANVRSPKFDLEPGKTYRLRFDVTLGGQPAAGDHSLVRFVTEGSGYWKSFGNQTFRPKTGETKNAETIFRIPLPGETDYDERNKGFTLHFQHISKDVDSKGWSQFGNVVLETVVPATEWEAWQMQGCDRNSLVVDPLFVDAVQGDYRLRPDSPALKKGFEQIPFEKIGPYADPRRASWPIAQSEGVREHPEWLRVPGE